jgi:hypothetical protein
MVRLNDNRKHEYLSAFYSFSSYLHLLSVSFIRSLFILFLRVIVSLSPLLSFFFPSFLLFL